MIERITSTNTTRREIIKRGLGGLAGLSMLGLAGCDSGTTGNTSLSAIAAQPTSGKLNMLFWGSPTRDKLTRATFDLYQKRNPGFSFASQYYAFGDYFNKLDALIKSGHTPDLIQMDMRYVAGYVRKGQLLDMTELIYNQNIDLSDYDPDLLDGSKVNNTVYGIPFGGNYQSFFYDATQIAKAGIGDPPATFTWESYATYTAELTRALGGNVYGSTDLSSDITTFEIWIRQRGIDLYDHDGHVAFSLTDVGDWYNYWNTLLKKGGCLPISIQKGLDVSGSPANASMIQKKSVFLDTYSNLLETFQAATSNRLGIMLPPVGGEGTTQPGMYLKASMLLSISSTTKYPLASANYVNFVNNNGDAVKALGIERGIPGSTKALTLLRPLLTPVEQTIADYMNTVRGSGNSRTKDVLDPPGAGPIADLLRTVSYTISAGSASVSAGAQTFYTQAKKIAG
jgi:multiple sugar transport system substrate-binding protein